MSYLQSVSYASIKDFSLNSLKTGAKFVGYTAAFAAIAAAVVGLTYGYALGVVQLHGRIGVKSTLFFVAVSLIAFVWMTTYTTALSNSA